MKKPKIIVFDLETIWDIDKITNEEVYFSLSNWEGRTMKASINSILCFGYKELGSKKAECNSVWDYKKRFAKNMNDDYDVCKAAYDVLKDADAIITHNGKRFDWKFLQTRLKINKLPHLDKILHIDTCHIARSNLSMYSNRLKDLAAEFTPERKINTGGKKLWTRIYRGDKSAMFDMVKYCKQDVVTTEALFESLRPFVTNLPNFNLFNNNPESCTGCGGSKLQRNGKLVTKTKIHQRLRCTDCGCSKISKPEVNPAKGIAL